jgi:hypothetical protein
VFLGMALRLKNGGPLPKVGDRLAVGTCDVSGAGVRALLGFVPADGVHAVVHDLELVSLAPALSDDSDFGAVFVTDHDTTVPTAPSVSLVTLGDTLSLLIVNQQVRPADEAAVAAAVYSMATDAGCGRVFILGALRLDEKRGGVSGGANDALVLEFGDAATEKETNESDSRTIRDGTLAALTHVMRATSTPTTCVFVGGHRVVGLGGDEESESEKEAAETARVLGTLAAEKINNAGGAPVVRFDATVASTYRASRAWRATTGAPENTDRMYT